MLVLYNLLKVTSYLRNLLFYLFLIQFKSIWDIYLFLQLSFQYFLVFFLFLTSPLGYFKFSFFFYFILFLFYIKIKSYFSFFFFFLHLLLLSRWFLSFIYSPLPILIGFSLCLTQLFLICRLSCLIRSSFGIIRFEFNFYLLNNYFYTNSNA